MSTATADAEPTERSFDKALAITERVHDLMKGFGA